MATTPHDWTTQTSQSQNISQPAAGNPLAKHFRSPAIQLKLPSGGRFWQPGSLEVSSTGEYAVFPMTARDEMTFNNPDALMNGQAVVDVIQSCIPAVKNAWAMPSIDVDSVLIAIRIASYGETMDFSSTCPQCSDENDFAMDLRLFIDRNVDVNIFDQPRTHSDLTFKFKPQVYETINNLNIESFESQRLAGVVENSEISDEEKITQFNAIFNKMNQRTVDIFADAIESITTQDGTVVDNPAFIDDFLKNCDRKVFQFVRESIDEIAQAMGVQDTEIVCANCSHKYTIPFTFDNANFFG